MESEQDLPGVPKPKLMVRDTLLAASILLGLSLLTIPLENDAFEFCTTKAYGLPFPWRVAWCECTRGEDWLTQSFYWAGNLVVALLGGRFMVWVIRR